MGAYHPLFRHLLVIQRQQLAGSSVQEASENALGRSHSFALLPHRLPSMTALMLKISAVGLSFSLYYDIIKVKAGI